MAFDFTSRDAQGTVVEPIAPERFDLEAYAEYAARLDERCARFLEQKSGVLVYRRFRVPEVYSYGSRDMTWSLPAQLGALKMSMDFEADVPNFLEPWYGIGAASAAFGEEYIWQEGQAPATVARFEEISEALEFEPTPIEETQPGRETLRYIEYFLEKTKGMLPISLGDIQSPLNAAGNIVNISGLFMEMLDEPERYERFAGTLTDLIVRFLKKQQELLGGCLARPGHGFASSRAMRGIGISDDNIVMLSNAMYEEFEAPLRVRMSEPFGGTAFHSCGNWSRHIPAVQTIGNLICVDGAFSADTDPDPNPAEPFRDAFRGTGVTLHVRIVGGADQVTDIVKKLWAPDLKLIVCTYCSSAEEQKRAYDAIHTICT